MTVHEMRDNPEKIWLEPGCSPERCWCENPLDDCDEDGCGAEAIGYVREDIVEHAAREAEKLAEDNQRLRAALVRWLDAVNDKYAFEHHQPDNLGKEWKRVREAVNLAENNASAVLLRGKP